MLLDKRFLSLIKVNLLLMIAKKKLLHQIAFVMIFIATVLLYAMYYEENAKSSSSAIGILASFVTIGL
jgi:hypothetical protein